MLKKITSAQDIDSDSIVTKVIDTFTTVQTRPVPVAALNTNVTSFRLILRELMRMRTSRKHPMMSSLFLRYYYVFLSVFLFECTSQEDYDDGGCYGTTGVSREPY